MEKIENIAEIVDQVLQKSFMVLVNILACIVYIIAIPICLVVLLVNFLVNLCFINYRKK